MKQAIILANGQMEAPTDLSSEIKDSALVIAADGGVHHCLSLGLQPDVLIGDLDSVSPDELLAYRNTGVEILQFPTHKDETDLELALIYAKDQGVKRVTLLGGLGARWDMTLANILLICHPAYANMNIHFLDGTQELFLLKAGENTTIDASPGDILSLIPLSEDVSGVTSSGLEYPLKQETLQFGTPRGVSNVFLEHQVQISIKQGLLICIVNRNRT
jgi:thiamine pyrophosphokinase